MLYRSSLRRICNILVLAGVASVASAQLVNVDGLNSNGSGRAVSGLQVSQRGVINGVILLNGNPLPNLDSFEAGQGLQVTTGTKITYSMTNDAMTSLSLAHSQNTDIGTTNNSFTIGMGNSGDTKYLFLSDDFDQYLGYSSTFGYYRLNAGSLLVDGEVTADAFNGVGSGLTGISLPQLSDVTVTTPANGQVLTYNGSQWVNSAITGYVPTSRTISTDSPLTGGGDLSANRTISIPKATSSADGYLSSADWSLFDGKVSPTRAVNTGLGLTGGGNLSSDRTIAIDTAVVPQLGVNNTFAGSNSFKENITIYEDGNTPKINFGGGGVLEYDFTIPWFSFNQHVIAPSLEGNGSGITDINASNIASGTIDNARLPTTAQKFSGEVTILIGDNFAQLTSIPISAGDTVVVSYKGASNGGGALWADTDTVGGWYVFSTNYVSADTTIVWRVLKN